jgi:dTDP-4-dehydrorhamnose reductase
MRPSNDNLEDARPLLVIGADGLVGRHVTAALRDVDVVLTYRHDVAGGVTLDITDSDAVRRVVREARRKVIVLAAADAHVERCGRAPVETRRVNVEAARVVAVMARETGVPIRAGLGRAAHLIGPIQWRNTGSAARQRGAAN